ncbi:MAG: hypothetical protein HYV16_14260 [Gammaproteobacteria bacterium]|nr:hypothetical protein [Gammaproteobacteria bacterium]
MTMVKGPLGLSIRERSATAAASLDFSARPLQAWIEALPLANVGETARLVYQAVSDLNLSQLAEAERMRVLASLGSPIQFIIVALRKHYLNQSISLNEKQRKIAALAQALRSEMAIGYKTVIESMLAADQQRFDARLLQSALFHALDYLGAMLLHCYQLYAPQPPGLWREMHLLYHFAEQNQLHDQPVGESAPPQSVASLYKKALLLAAANPYQLRQQDCERLYHSLNEWADKCRIPPINNDNNQFVVNLLVDSPPIYQAMAKEKLDRNWRCLDVNELLQYLQDELRANAAGEAAGPAPLSPALLRHLVRAWGNMTTRAFSRTSCAGHIRVSIGLGATHFLLQGGEQRPVEPASAMPTLAEFSGSLSDATLVDDHRAHVYEERPKAGGYNELAFERIYRWQGGQLGQGEPQMEAKPNSFANAESRPAYEFQSAELVNISPGGYCLQLDGALPVQTQTGEVIGLLESDDEDAAWNIGTIRWMRRTPQGPLQAGVQLLAPNAHPVFTQLRSSRSEGMSFQRSLLLPALKGIGQPATLITPTMPYQLNQKVRIQDGAEEYDARLTKLVAATAGYKQFHFERLAATRSADSSPSRPGDEDNFDSVWTLI